jgi:hypothetical protein
LGKVRKEIESMKNKLEQIRQGRLNQRSLTLEQVREQIRLHREVKGGRKSGVSNSGGSSNGLGSKAG